MVMYCNIYTCHICYFVILVTKTNVIPARSGDPEFRDAGPQLTLRPGTTARVTSHARRFR
jgi:hypothetical protein